MDRRPSPSTTLISPAAVLQEREIPRIASDLLDERIDFVERPALTGLRIAGQRPLPSPITATSLKRAGARAEQLADRVERMVVPAGITARACRHSLAAVVRAAMLQQMVAVVGRIHDPMDAEKAAIFEEHRSRRRRGTVERDDPGQHQRHRANGLRAVCEHVAEGHQQRLSRYERDGLGMPGSVSQLPTLRPQMSTRKRASPARRRVAAIGGRRQRRLTAMPDREHQGILEDRVKISGATRLLNTPPSTPPNDIQM